MEQWIRLKNMKEAYPVETAEYARARNLQDKPSFRKYLRECMKDLDFTSCLADPDGWMRKGIDLQGKENYEYVLFYTDDKLVISHQPEKILRNELNKYFNLKEVSMGAPEIYLGGKMRKENLDNGLEAWGFSSAQYIKNAVTNAEQKLHNDGRKLPKKAPTPFAHDYRPDISPELQMDKASYYKSLIDILRWVVEVGRIDICCEDSMMATCLALPRYGHLNALIEISSI